MLRRTTDLDNGTRRAALAALAPIRRVAIPSRTSQRGRTVTRRLTFEIAATMGTSLEELSQTYAHLLPDSAERARVALNVFINQTAGAAESDGGGY